ncbi:hypothetical protein PRIPAC_89439 [Pristionchus pacificus]|uniref:Uncharacterized protein n=1 Tax=Pristionchus pacificus TaxID=54126 RepID=A0A2A6CZ17_PRIPA|nr:hypothetical protein PRIPAC_89439 [Pristionchus pacificus]|eukprot:PDM83368.1 hypothetical protein PRIPAC_35000 [Pristionchus pacificus]
MLSQSVSLLLASLIQSTNQCKVFSAKFRRLCRDAEMDSLPIVGNDTTTTTVTSIDGSKVGYEPPEIYITLTLLGALLFLICVCLPPFCKRFFFLPMEVLAADTKIDGSDDDEEEEEDDFNRLGRRDIESTVTRTISM